MTQPAETVSSFEVTVLLRNNGADPLECWNNLRARLGKNPVKTISDLAGGVELATRGLTGRETEQIYSIFDSIEDQL